MTATKRIRYAVTGLYRPARKYYGQWAVDWMHWANGQRGWSSPRFHLFNQLKAIRSCDGTGQALEFRDYLRWLGCYPSKRRATRVG